MGVTLKLIGGKLYNEINLLESNKDIIVAYLMMMATPEEIEFRVKNLQSLLNIHGEIETVLNVLPRDLLLKIAKRVEERVAKKAKKVVGKGSVKKPATKKKATTKKKVTKKLPI